MVQTKRVFASFSVNDKEKAKEFYTTMLGLEVTDNGMGLQIHLSKDDTVFAYQKDNHKPATFTVLNFVVDDIDTVVDDLTKSGITFERYDGMPQDEKGIMRGLSKNMGPDIAWFLDPAGNILSVIQDH